MQLYRFRYRTEPDFDLRLVLFSHGWIDLPPFAWDEDTGLFSTAVAASLGGPAVDLSLRRTDRGLSATVAASRALTSGQLARLRGVVPYMLRMDADLTGFWSLCETEPRLRWAAQRGAGRIFRSDSVFQDLMKLLFTTNCSWAATRLMTSRLIEALGRPTLSGNRAFPSAAACARHDETFYREVVRAGYRARHCVRLATDFASGELSATSFTDPDLSTDALRKRLLALPGFGPYAAGQALRLLGHYEDLALDSWCRSHLAPLSDAAIARRYAAFHPYNGLALWLDLTASWHEGA